ncbi:MAG: biopolymer transporter ExbD [Bdellovibrio sp.]|nr:biopolymer transporter ExbD [Bdellovibrio sp.]
MSSFAKKIKLRRRKKEPTELDITSLLDILTILLVFLLRSYNATDLKLDVAQGVTLPTAQSQDLGSYALVLQVNKKRELFFNNKLVTQLDVTGKGGSDLEKLLTVEAEHQRKEMAARHPASQPDSKPVPLKINLLFDKDLPYEVVGNVLHLAASSGHSKFKFIVQGKGQ